MIFTHQSTNQYTTIASLISFSCETKQVVSGFEYLCIKTHLPQIKSNCTNVLVGIEFVIRSIVRVVNLRVDPFALVVRVVNLLGLPFTLHSNKTASKTMQK